MVTRPHLQYNLNHTIKFVGDVIDRNYDVITFFQNIFIVPRPGLAIFADIIKIVTIFVKTIKDLVQFKRIRDYVSKYNLYLYLLISSEKMQMSPELKGCVTGFIYFLDLL